MIFLTAAGYEEDDLSFEEEFEDFDEYGNLTIPGMIWGYDEEGNLITPDNGTVFDEYGNLISITIDGKYYVWDDVYGFQRGIKLPFKNLVNEKYVYLHKASITLNCVYQEPELPTGCEIVATDTVLKYLGFPISKTKLADTYFLDETEYKDFRYYYAGNPYTDYGLGCYAPAVTIAANKYLSVCDSNYIAFNYTGYEFESLLNEVAKGNPVIVWATIEQKEPYKGLDFKFGDEVVSWISMEHCLVLCGYDLDNKTVKVSDPLVGIVDYDMQLFKNRFLQLKSQAVVIRDKSNYMNKKNIPKPFIYDKNIPKR